MFSTIKPTIAVAITGLWAASAALAFGFHDVAFPTVDVSAAMWPRDCPPMLEKLPPDSPYRRTVYPTLASVVRNLVADARAAASLGTQEMAGDRSG